MQNNTTPRQKLAWKLFKFFQAEQNIMRHADLCTLLFDNGVFVEEPRKTGETTLEAGG